MEGYLNQTDPQVQEGTIKPIDYKKMQDRWDRQARRRKKAWKIFWVIYNTGITVFTIWLNYKALTTENGRTLVIGGLSALWMNYVLFSQVNGEWLKKLKYEWLKWTILIIVASYYITAIALLTTRVLTHVEFVYHKEKIKE